MPRSTSCANSAPMPVYGRLTPTFTSWACARAVVMASAATATATIRFIMREALPPIEAEIVEIAAKTDEDFAKEGRDADALYAKGRRVTKTIIDGLPRCKVIALGSVGVDSVDVAAATARGIPVTNVPDTFIEEVADHAMTLILATFRRLVVQDRLVRAGRWREGRPMLYELPRLMGQTLGLIAFGHVARAVAVRARPFGVHMLAYDPYIEELVMSQYGVEPVCLTE